MGLPNTATLALSGPLGLPEMDGARTWFTTYDDDMEDIQARCTWGQVVHDIHQVSRSGLGLGLGWHASMKLSSPHRVPQTFTPRINQGARVDTVDLMYMNLGQILIRFPKLFSCV